MASPNQVKQYLAHWFQLGKCVWIHNGRESLKPTSIIQGDHYSSEFEKCWETIQSSNAGDCYLEGTDQTIQELLSARWELGPCARCEMLIPMASLGLPIERLCPCHDLISWPNLEIPQPRLPVNSNQRLEQICDRLQAG
jgi:hypothetical protein